MEQPVYELMLCIVILSYLNAEFKETNKGTKKKSVLDPQCSTIELNVLSGKGG